MSRREFLLSAGRIGLAAGGLPFLLKYNVLAAEPPPDVVVAKGKSLRTMFREGLKPLGGMEAFVKKGSKVVLKPNASLNNSPDWGNVTSPDLVREVAKLCLSAGAEEIVVLDHPLQGGANCFTTMKLDETLARVRKTTLKAILEEGEYHEIEVPKGKALKKVEAAKDLEGAVLINLPQAKHHVATNVSLGLKNLMGLVYNRNQFHHDFDLSQGIADLATAVTPALTIVDATRIMTTKGPTGPGTVEQHDTIVLGRQPASVDAVTLGLTKWTHRRLKAEQVAHIRLASELGLGGIDIEKLRVQSVEA